MTRLERWSPVLTGLAGGLICLPILSNGLTNWDDVRYIVENPLVSAGLGGIVRAFAEPFDHAYYPVTQTLLVLVNALFGASPLALHGVQLLLFAGACALLPRALATFGVPPALGVATTLLWLAHPFRVESTAWAANLKDATSLFFVVLAFALYGSGRKTTSAVAWVLGLLSKSMVAPLGLLFVGLDLVHPARSRGAPFDSAQGERFGPAVWRSARFWLPAAAVSVVAAVLHLRASDPWQVPPANMPTRLWMPAWYLMRLLWPAAPRAVYLWPRLGWDDPRPWIGALLVGSALAWVLLPARLGLPGRIVGRWLLAAFALPLASVVGVVPMGQQVAERYTLFASIPLALAIAWLLFRLPKPAGLGLLLGLLAVESVATVRRERQWHDALSLWSANLPLAPDDFTVHYNLAGALGGEGRFAEAHQHLLAAYAQRPSWPGLDCLLATAQAASEKLDPGWIDQVLPKICAAGADERWLAARQLLAAKDRRGELLLEQLSLGSHTSAAAALLGALALQRGDARRAIGLARRARLLDARNEEALMTEASALLIEHRTQEAVVATQTQVANPRVAAALKGIRGAALFELGKIDEAQVLLDQSKEELKALERLPP